MFTKPPSAGTAALLVAVAIVVATGCTASRTGVTTTSSEHLVERGDSETTTTPSPAQESAPGEADADGGSVDTAATTPETSTPGDGTALGPQDDAKTQSVAEDSVELDLSDLDALLADLDGLLGDIDDGIGQLGNSFDNDEGDVEE